MIVGGVADFIGALAGPFILFILVALTYRALNKRKLVLQPVDDGPEGEPYSVYTRAFDHEIAARDVAATLPRASPDVVKGWYQRDHALWLPCIPRVNALLAETGPWDGAFEKICAAASGLDPHDLVVALLIDQSGSMKGAKMAWAAVLATRITEYLTRLGAKSEVLGFTTAGWHGGHAYAAWRDAGSPPRPGRLCALMHVVYKSADEPSLTEKARNIMLDPALLRENIDGEAVLWASERLSARPEPRKILIVISDGAPVDDATLMHNGPSYLYRHLTTVLTAIEEARDLTIGGLGIGHRVDALYPLSETIEAPADLPAAGLRLLETVIGASGERAPN